MTDYANGTVPVRDLGSRGALIPGWPRNKGPAETTVNDPSFLPQGGDTYIQPKETLIGNLDDLFFGSNRNGAFGSNNGKLITP